MLADKYDRYKITYTGCHVFNPGSFIGNSFVFSTYKPSEANSEEWWCERNCLSWLIADLFTVYLTWILKSRMYLSGKYICLIINPLEGIENSQFSSCNFRFGKTSGSNNSHSVAPFVCWNMSPRWRNLCSFWPAIKHLMTVTDQSCGMFSRVFNNSVLPYLDS